MLWVNAAFTYTLYFFAVLLLSSFLLPMLYFWNPLCYLQILLLAVLSQIIYRLRSYWGYMYIIISFYNLVYYLLYTVKSWPCLFFFFLNWEQLFKPSRGRKYNPVYCLTSCFCCFYLDFQLVIRVFMEHDFLSAWDQSILFFRLFIW